MQQTTPRASTSRHQGRRLRRRAPLVLALSAGPALGTAACGGHGVPDFPDPSGQAGQLGPTSGIDPNSSEFQAALNGPCQSLAPPGWAGSGKVTR